jgi:hypothetical protein
MLESILDPDALAQDLESAEPREDARPGPEDGRKEKDQPEEDQQLHGLRVTGDRLRGKGTQFRSQYQNISLT